jgi:hypothetical protein
MPMAGQRSISINIPTQNYMYEPNEKEKYEKWRYLLAGRTFYHWPFADGNVNRHSAVENGKPKAKYTDHNRLKRQSGKQICK